MSGNRGSGTTFFSARNLRCVFCQNHEISRLGRGRPAEPEELAGDDVALCRNRVATTSTW
jgi:putative pyruvate formate lyase activating enzyme